MNPLKKLRLIQRQRRIQSHYKKQESARNQNPYYSKKTQYSLSQTSVMQWLKKDGWALGGILILVSSTLYYFGFMSGKYQIQAITISETQYIAQEEVQSTVQDVLTKRRWLVLPQSNFWTLNALSVEQRLHEQFDYTFALESVRVEKQYPNGLHIELLERVPSLQWSITTESGEEKTFLVDREGVVTGVTNIGVENTNEPVFPVVYDKNRTNIEPGWHIIASTYINSLLQLKESIPSVLHYEVASFTLPKIDCVERQYVTEKIFQQEILDSSSEEFKQKKRKIQEQFQAGELSIDESLLQLEQVKNEELSTREELSSNEEYEQLEWASVNVPVVCDIVQVATDVSAHIQKESLSFDLYIDTTEDVVTQLHNAQLIVENSAVPLESIEYIDVRVLDRAYYK